jgi:LmbE family N-acetylglucosaminyl deacetylase
MSFYVPARAVAIAAHCDDLDVGSSGTVARWTEGGSAVTYVIATDSGAGSNTPGEDLEALKATRREEQTRSAAEVGVRDIRFLDHTDGVLEPTLELRKQLTRIIREVRPDVVLTFDPEMVVSGSRTYINHPDHRAVGEAAMYATFPSAGSRPIFAELLDEGFQPHDPDYLYLQFSNVPTYRVDISSTMELKKRALRHHTSQFDEDFVKQVQEWASRDAEGLSAQFAEAFRVVNLTGE